VRGVRDFQLNYRISLALELNGIVGLASRAAQEHIAVAHVLEHNSTIVFGMNALFHIFNIFVIYLLDI
jgi:hypothetical protein